MSQSVPQDEPDSSILGEARAEAPTPTARDMPAADAPPAAASKGSLWRDANFLILWAGQALSQFGAEITGLAIPVLAVLILDATEWEVGILNAAQVAAFLVVGLPAGAWIDRMRKRRVMMWADVVRAVALGSIPLLWLLGVLQVWQLFLVALVVGVAMVFFDVSYQSQIGRASCRERVCQYV